MSLAFPPLQPETHWGIEIWVWYSFFSSQNTGRKKKYPWVFFIMVLIEMSALGLVFKAIAHQVSFNVKGRSVAFGGGWVGRVASPHLPQSTRWYRECLHLVILCFYCFDLDYYFSIALKKKKKLIVAVQGGRSVKMCLPHHSESCKCNG